jgi:hypothetical protein
VANTKQAEIDALKNSTCGTADERAKRRRLGITIENAQRSYADLLGLKPPAKIFVTTSDGNGGQPVMVVRGPQFKTDQPAHVHTHYHGDNATVADPLGSKDGHNARIRAVVMKEDTLAVFVLPEADNPNHCRCAHGHRRDAGERACGLDALGRRHGAQKPDAA